MTAHAGWQRVLLAPLQQRRNQGSRWFWPALVVVALLMLVGAALLPRVPLAWAAVTLLATLALGLWMALVISLIVQNEPHAARLVPGHVRALRRVLLVAGLAFLAVAGAVGAAFGHALPTLGATLLALLVVAWIVRMPALGMLGWIVPMLVSRVSKSPAFEAMVGATSDAVLARPGWAAAGATAALLAAVAWSLPQLLQGGDVRHQRSYRARTRLRVFVRHGRVDQTRWATTGRLGCVLRELSTWPYQRMLARISARRSGDVLGRSLVGLGPVFHWSGQLGSALVFGAIGLLLLSVVWGVGLPGAHLGGASGAVWPLSLGLMTFVVNLSVAARTALYHSRREQALLMLLPGMPRAAALNRPLAVRLLIQFVVTWALGLLACAALVPFQARQFGWLVTLACVGLPWGALLWRDWSRLPPPSPMTAAAPVVGVMLLAACAVGLQLVFDWPVWTFALGFVWLTLALLAWRWRGVTAAPSAFPVGRRS